MDRIKTKFSYTTPAFRGLSDHTDESPIPITDDMETHGIPAATWEQLAQAWGKMVKDGWYNGVDANDRYQMCALELCKAAANVPVGVDPAAYLSGVIKMSLLHDSHRTIRRERKFRAMQIDIELNPLGKNPYIYSNNYDRREIINAIFARLSDGNRLILELYLACDCSVADMRWSCSGLAQCSQATLYRRVNAAIAEAHRVAARIFPGGRH